MATIEAIKAWNIERTLVAMVFDTTASNAGWMNGAAKIIEEHFGKKLLWCACRHHIYERVLSSVYTKIFGESRSPNYEPFRQFKDDIWSKLSANSDAPFKKIQIEERALKSRREEVIKFMSDILEKKSLKIVRDDYRECCQLALQLLNQTNIKVNWHKPGAFHHARWMCTILYTSKMFAFADLAGYKKGYVLKLERFCKFTMLFYVQLWLTCTDAIDAPFNDMEFYRHMLDYKKYDSEVAVAALKAFNRHLWFLTEEMAPLSLFSDKISDSDKIKISHIISRNLGVNFEHERGLPTFPILKPNTHLTDLAGPKSTTLLMLFGYSNHKGGWLTKLPKLWKEDSNFQHMLEHIKSLKTVNDAAERAVKLIQDYATSITKDEEQKQFLLQAVEHHRKMLPDMRKGSIRKLKL